MAKKTEAETGGEMSVDELKKQLADANAEKEMLAKKLAEAENKEAKAAKAPEGVKYTKAAPAGEPGSDGNGTLIKFVNPKREDVIKELEAAGWVKAS